MGNNIFIVPCDPGDYDRTVRTPVDLSGYSDFPEPLGDQDEVRFWGARDGEGNRSYFQKMKTEDLVLFYQKIQYIGVDFVGTTFEDEERRVSTTFWNNAPSQLIYTIKEFSSVSVLRGKLNRIFGYSEDIIHRVSLESQMIALRTGCKPSN